MDEEDETKMIIIVDVPPKKALFKSTSRAINYFCLLSSILPVWAERSVCWLKKLLSLLEKAHLDKKLTRQVIIYCLSLVQ